MTEPDLDLAVRLLAEAWNRRSPAERAAVARDLTAEPVEPLPGETVRLVRDRAALSGAVSPRDLVRGLSQDLADRVLDAVSPDFDRALVDGVWLWTLNSGARAESLGALAARGVERALEDVTSIPTDEAGEILRALVRTRTNVLLDRFLPRRPDAVLQALTWAAPLGGHAGDLAEARRRASLGAIRDSYAFLLSHGVRGREPELQRLHAFVDAPVDPSSPVPLLAVTGVGGSGKSTVLGEFVRPYLDRMETGDEDGPAVIVIDFDRVLFRVHSEVELSFEVTRQLGYAAPIASADFSVLRHQTREERRHGRLDRNLSTHRGETEIRTTIGFEEEAAALVAMHGLERRPVLLVLDTFEEWQRDRPYEHGPRTDWNSSEVRIAEWITRLRERMGLGGLRVIASGRARVSMMDGHAVELGELDHDSSVRVLEDLDVEPSAADVLADVVGGNPLTLQVAARFYRRLPPVERERFIETAHETDLGLEEDVRRAVLYDRFLRHIKDDGVRALAHPGLVLRLVTPELVRGLLAERCGLGEVDEAAAERLVERLRDEVWLVKSTEDGLRHHPDVRRVMLDMMTKDEAYAEVVALIHRDAERWYREDSSPAGEAEWFYHRLVLEKGDRSVLEIEGFGRWNSVRVSLGASILDLRPAVRTQVRAMCDEDLGVEEAASLPDDVWRVWSEAVGTRMVSDGRVDLALRIWEARTTGLEPTWAAKAYCDTGRWEDYWTRATEPDGDSTSRTSGRYALINSLMERTSQERYDRHLGFEIEHRSPGAVEFAFLALLRARGFGSDQVESMGLPAPPGAGRSTLSVDLYPVDQFRRALVWAADARNELVEFVDVAGLFRPDPAWLRTWSRLFEGDNSALEFVANLPERQDRSIYTPRSHEVLGDWARRFQRAWGTDRPLRIDLFQAHPEAVFLLRGDNPELRPAIGRALDGVIERFGLRRVAEIAQALLPVPMHELRPEVLSIRVVQLVEYVDRSGVMGTFLERLTLAYPQEYALRRVTEVFRAWDTAHDRLLHSIADSLQSGMDS